MPRPNNHIHWAGFLLAAIASLAAGQAPAPSAAPAAAAAAVANGKPAAPKARSLLSDLRFYSLPTPESREFDCPAGPQPVLDGRLDDECWGAASVIGPLVDDQPGALPAMATLVRGSRTQTHLYLAFECQDTTTNQSKPYQEFDQRRWPTEGVYIILRGEGGESSVLAVSPSGAQSDSHQPPGGQRQWKAAVLPTEVGWNAEIAIPLQSVGLRESEAESKAAINFIRKGLGGGAVFAWSPTAGDIRNLRRGGVLYFERPPPATREVDLRASLDRNVYPSAEAKAQLSVVLPGTRSWWRGQKLFLRIEPQNPNGREAPKLPEADAARIEGGCAYALLDFAPLPAGEYNLVVSVGEARDAVLATRRVPFSRVAGPPPGLTGAIPILVPPGPIRYEGWPVRSAVALPKGAVTDLSQIRLLDRGRESPCGLSAISRWAPDGSLRWVGLDFPAYISAGSPMTYTVEYGPAVKRAAAKGIEHWSVAGVIVVNAGAVMLNVPQNSFVGVQDAWVDSNRDGVFTDAEQVIWTRRGPAGPYLVDAEGQRYLASLDPDPRVTVEEAGDYRNVIRAEGWLVAEPAAAPAPAAADKPAEAPKPQPAPAQPPSKRLGRFLTRIISYYGQPFFRVQQTFIFTQEPAKTPIQDMGFLIQAETHPDSRTVAMGADGRAHEFKLADKPLCLIQSGPGACEVQGGPEPIQAKASDGWGAVFSTRPHRRGPIHKGLSVVLANASRRYPNEIEVTPAGHIVVHTWPAHWPAGAARAAVASLKDTGRLDAFHTGPLLNLSLSGGAAGGAAGAEKTAVEEAVKSSALGVAVTTDILFLPEAGPMNTQAVMQMARINAAAPHALPSAHSLAAAGVLPAAAMPAAAEFQAAQAAMTSLWARLLQNEQRDPQDGLFNYLSFHSEWLSEGRWRLSNHWVGVRHGLPSALWSLYLFTGDPAVRLAASDNTRLLADVAVCHYDTPEAAALTDLASRKVRGGFAQPATFVQWYAANGLTKWWSRPDFLGLAYVISGEPRALDALQEWAAALPLAEGYPSGDDGLATLSGLAAAWEIAPTPLNLHRLRLAASAVLDGFVEDITPSHYASSVLHYGRLTGDPKAADFLQRLAGRCAASRDATENPAYLEIYAGAQALTGSPRFAETARHCAEGLLAAKASLEKPSWATAAALFRGLPCALALPAQAAPATP